MMSSPLLRLSPIFRLSSTCSIVNGTASHSPMNLLSVPFRSISHSELPGYRKRYEQWHHRGPGKPNYPRITPIRIPGSDYNLQERLDIIFKEENDRRKKRKDIGEVRKKKETAATRRQKMIEMRKAQRANPELERAARNRTLEVDLDDVSAEYLDCGDLFIDIREAADLYGVYEDLFDKDTLFTPSRYMEVRYDVKDDRDLVLPVHRGNIVKPKEATVAPNVAWQVEDGDEDALWTLVMTTPDGHFKDESSEYLHWMVGNIKGDDLATGTTLCEYMQPFPPFGTGYHRYVFVLYKQSGELDFSSMQKPSPCHDLDARSFKTSEFHLRFSSDLVPSGLAFFQSDYDSTLRDFYHNVLEMKEPRYEYHFIQPYYRDWSSLYTHRHKRPFNLSLDRHRDPKNIQQELVEKKMKIHHPFKGDLEARWKYPNLMHIDPELPQWRRREIERERLRQGVYKDLDWKELRRDPDTHA